MVTYLLNVLPLFVVYILLPHHLKVLMTVTSWGFSKIQLTQNTFDFFLLHFLFLVLLCLSFWFEPIIFLELHPPQVLIACIPEEVKLIFEGLPISNVNLLIYLIGLLRIGVCASSVLGSHGRRHDGTPHTFKSNNVIPKIREHIFARIVIVELLLRALLWIWQSIEIFLSELT